MSNHTINRKRARRQTARRIATKERELQKLDRTEITVATPQDIAARLKEQKARAQRLQREGRLTQQWSNWVRKHEVSS